MRERSLVMFTLSVQTSAGAYMILAVLQLIGSDEVLTLPVIAILSVLLGLSLLAAFFHLGSPGRAFRALSNLRSSWLSREILAVSVFGCLLLVQGVLLLSGLSASRLLAAVTAVTALALVIVIGRVYMLSVVPVWNSPLTILSFFASSIMLGGGLVLLLYSPMDSFSKYVFTVVVLIELALLVEITVSIWRYWLTVRGNRIGTLRRYGDIHHPGVVPARVRAVHLGLMLIFGVILGIGSTNFLLLWISFFLAFMGQAAGRVLFYEAGLGKRR